MSVVAFVDCETTGLHADRHEVWEVGLITPRQILAEGTPLTTYARQQWLLPVERLADADPFALEIGRFHTRHPQGNALPYTPGERPEVTPLATFARQFAKATHGLHLAGAVVSFDEERLRRLLWSQGQTHGWHYHVVDVEALAAGYLAHNAAMHSGDPSGAAFAAVARPPWDSNKLSDALGIDPNDYDRHTALGDCEWAKAIYDAVMGNAE